MVEGILLHRTAERRHLGR